MEASDVEVDVGTAVEVDAPPADVVVGEVVVFSTGALVLIRPLSHVHSYPTLLPCRRCDAEAVELLVATEVVVGTCMVELR